VSRHFERDFATDLLTFSAGALSTVDGGPLTFVAVFRLDQVSNDQVIVRARTAANATVWDVIHSGAQLFFETSAGFVGCSSGLSANTWYMWVVTKGNGSSTVRDHLCVMTAAGAGDTWTHTNRGSLADGSGTVDHVRVSDGTGSARMDGYVAAEAVFTSVLDDTAVEALRTGLAAWASAGPASMWRFNDTPVNDLGSAVANQLSIDGTTVDTGVEPPAFSYSLTTDMTGAVTLDAPTLAGALDSFTVVSPSGWYAYLSIVQEARDIIRTEGSSTPLACPNDGEPLSSGPHGEPFCRFDGWRPGSDVETEDARGGWR
jgi:hypothetical protein